MQGFRARELLWPSSAYGLTRAVLQKITKRYMERSSKCSCWASKAAQFHSKAEKKQEQRCQTRQKHRTDPRPESKMLTRRVSAKSDIPLDNRRQDSEPIFDSALNPMHSYMMLRTHPSKSSVLSFLAWGLRPTLQTMSTEAEPRQTPQAKAGIPAPGEARWRPWACLGHLLILDNNSNNRKYSNSSNNRKIAIYTCIIYIYIIMIIIILLMVIIIINSNK